MGNNNGFTINLNRISRAEFRAWMRDRETAEDIDLFDFEQLYSKIITTWPFDSPVSVESFLELGMLDSRRVDDAVSDAIEAMSKKKSETPST